MALKAGSVDDIANSMASNIEAEFILAWNDVYGRPLPNIGSRQRRVFFVAIARGVLRSLKDHDGSISAGSTGGGSHLHNVEFDVDDLS